MSDTSTSLKRAKVTGVTLNIEYPDGTSRVITLNPQHTKGLFWSDETVLKILAPYYEKVDSEMTKEEFIDRFGPEAAKIIGKTSKIKITENVVKKLWNTPDSHGFLRAVMGKSNDCYPG